MWLGKDFLRTTPVGRSEPNLALKSRPAVNIYVSNSIWIGILSPLGAAKPQTWQYCQLHVMAPPSGAEKKWNAGARYQFQLSLFQQYRHIALDKKLSAAN